MRRYFSLTARAKYKFQTFPKVIFARAEFNKNTIAMDCAPLNLAHFHERRANRFLQRHRYDEAYKALETSLLYLQDAYKTACIPKSREVLSTQKWEYERKLRQIQMRKHQHERMKHKEIVPLSDANPAALTVRQDSNVTTQSVAKAIDKTIREFDAKLNMLMEKNAPRAVGSKENLDPRLEGTSNKLMVISEPSVHSHDGRQNDGSATHNDEHDEIPSLAPLELPSFDFHDFTTSTPSMANMTGLAESFQK